MQKKIIIGYRRIFTLPIWIDNFVFQNTEYNTFVRLRIQKSRRQIYSIFHFTTIPLKTNKQTNNIIIKKKRKRKKTPPKK